MRLLGNIDIQSAFSQAKLEKMNWTSYSQVLL
jgi:hypothetical protein